MSYPLSATVLEFAESCLRSVDELVVLTAMMYSSDRWWDDRMVARELGIARADNILDQLAKLNLLDIRVTDAVRYQFRPATPELSRAATEFADAYRRQPAEVMRVIVGRSADRGARDFADAFRIRRNDSG